MHYFIHKLRLDAAHLKYTDTLDSLSLVATQTEDIKGVCTLQELENVTFFGVFIVYYTQFTFWQQKPIGLLSNSAFLMLLNAFFINCTC